MRYELPYQLVDALAHVKGFNKPAFEAVHLSDDKLTSIRINPDKIGSVAVLDYITEPVAWCKDGYYLSERPVFTFHPLIHAGAFYVQEASSMFLWHILKNIEVNKNAKVLDLCAAPGGKSTLLSSFFKEGVIVCNEVIQTRAAILVENIVKWGNDNTIVTNNPSLTANNVTTIASITSTLQQANVAQNEIILIQTLLSEVINGSNA